MPPRIIRYFCLDRTGMVLRCKGCSRDTREGWSACLSGQSLPDVEILFESRDGAGNLSLQQEERPTEPIFCMKCFCQVTSPVACL